MHLRNRSIAMFALATLLAVTAGCSKSSTSPTAPGGDTTAPTKGAANVCAPAGALGTTRSE